MAVMLEGPANALDLRKDCTQVITSRKSVPLTLLNCFTSSELRKSEVIVKILYRYQCGMKKIW
jgi:hypothetical protein